MAEEGALLGTIPNVVRKKLVDRVYYFGTVTSDKVKDMAFVPVVETSQRTYLNEIATEGYQRPGSWTRMNQFRDFLVDHPNSLVPPVLLNARGQWTFKAMNDQPDYGILEVRGAAAIIDGQHRLGGYVALHEKKHEPRPLDFIALDGLTIEEEAREFVIVNSTQKGVPKSLTAFLGIDISDDPEQAENAWIAWGLNISEDSPLKGRITRTTAAKSHLFALHSVAKSIGRTFDHGKLKDIPRDDKLQIAIKYWTIIADTFPNEWSDIEKLDDENAKGRKDFEYKLLELTGFIAWSLAAPQILAPAYSDEGGMDWEKVERFVQACATIDWRKDGQYENATGEVGGKKIVKDIEKLLPAF